MVVAPSIDVVKRRVLIGSVAKLGRRSGGVSTRRNLNRSLVLPTSTIGFMGILQMVFNNPIIDGNKTTN
jgi:hypothetical protein